MRIPLLAVLLASASVCLTGCVTAVDDGCTSDNECYSGRVCVDGRCTGDVPLSPNNEENNANNNANNENNAENNENNAENNENNAENNENNGGNNENNVDNNDVNNGRLCMRGRDCDDDQVCTSFEPGAERWQCVEPWRCEPGIFEPSDAVCIADFFCEIDDGVPFRQIICEFGDQDNGVCFCFSEPDGVTYEFEASRAFCDPEGMTDLANTRCGWRVTDGSF